MAQIKRSYSAALYGFELNGISLGLVESSEGGNAVGEVVKQFTGDQKLPNQHIGGVKYEDITVNCGASMTHPFYVWLASELSGNHDYKNGAVVAYDYNMKEVSRLSFSNTAVSEVVFPALDASSKDAAKLRVTLTPQRTTRDTSNLGKAGPTGSGNHTAKWLVSNFRLKIDGLDCSRVSSIEAFGMKQKVTQNPLGQVGNSPFILGDVEISNLVITLIDDAKAADFYDWHKSFVIDGKNDQSGERNGTLEFLGANLQDVFFTLRFQHLGIFRLAAIQTSAESIARIQTEMYCEQVSLTTGSGTAVSTTAQPGTTSTTPISLPVNLGQLGVAASEIQTQATAKTGAVLVPRLANQVSAGTERPSQGPRNLKPLQQQLVTPRRPTLRFRNLSSTGEVT